MKKLFLISIMLVSALGLTAQIDSLQLVNTLNGAYEIGTILNSGKAFFPNVPNEWLHAAVTWIVFYIWHRRKINKLKTPK